MDAIGEEPPALTRWRAAHRSFEASDVRALRTFRRKLWDQRTIDQTIAYCWAKTVLEGEHNFYVPDELFLG